MESVVVLISATARMAQASSGAISYYFAAAKIIAA